MSRREKRPGRGAKPGVARAAKSGARRTAARAAIVAAAFAIAGLAAFGAWRASRRAAPALAARPTTADSAATLSMQDAYAEAARRALAGFPEQSLPFYRRVRDTMTNDAWEFHFEYGVVLSNCAIDDGVRSSYDRHVWIEEALSELEHAARQCPDPKKRAVIHLQRGIILRTWGLPVEALEAAAEAARLDPGYEAATTGHRSLLARMEHPEDASR